MSIREKLRALISKQRQDLVAADSDRQSQTASMAEAFEPIAKFLQELAGEARLYRTIMVEIGESRGSVQIRKEKIEVYCKTHGFRIRTEQSLDLPDGPDEIGEVHMFRTAQEVQDWILARVAGEMARWKE